MVGTNPTGSAMRHRASLHAGYCFNDVHMKVKGFLIVQPLQKSASGLVQFSWASSLTSLIHCRPPGGKDSRTHHQQ